MKRKEQHEMSDNWSQFDKECPICGKKMYKAFQPGLMAHQDGHWMIECQNRQCKLFKVTLSDKRYDEDHKKFLDE